jgi:transcriptional regulator with XRE-family HTH domain
MKNVDTKIALSVLVRTEREKRNWTQEQLAEIADVSPRTIQRLEADGTHSPETLRAVAGAFDVDCQDLIKRSSELAKGAHGATAPYHLVQLARCTNGKALFDTVKGCHALQPDYPGTLLPEQAEQVGALFDLVQDHGDIQDDLTPSQRIGSEREITAMINDLDEVELAVFVGTYEKKVAASGAAPMDWRFAVVTIIACDDARIVKTGEEQQTLAVLIPRKQRVSTQ